MRALANTVAASPEGQAECSRSRVRKASLADWLRVEWVKHAARLMRETAPSRPYRVVASGGGGGGALAAAALYGASPPAWQTAAAGGPLAEELRRIERHAALLADPHAYYLAGAEGSAALRAAAEAMAYCGAASITKAPWYRAAMVDPWADVTAVGQAYRATPEAESPTQKAVREHERMMGLARRGYLP